MPISKIIRIPKAFLRKLSHINKSIEAGTSLKGKIPLNLDDEPIETRTGFDVNDSSDFYESRFDKLYKFYSGYRNSPEFHSGLLYADIIALETEGTHPISDNLMPIKDIKINVSRLSYKLPLSLNDHAEHAVNLFKTLGKLKKINDTEEWENNESLSISNVITDTCCIEACRANYFDQVATNISLDWCSKTLPSKGGTIRNSSTLERPENGKLKSLDDSILANTLGVAVMLYNSDFEAFVRVRSDKLASISKKGLHCSASGVFEMKGGIKPGEYGFSVFEDGIKAEIKAEIGINESEYELYPLAFARELARGGKPQLFFIAITSLSNSEITERSINAKESWEFLDEDDEYLSEFKSFSELKGIMESFTYEGWACLQLAEVFKEVNPELLKRFASK